MTDADLRFFVLGAQKSATSWLYYCLRDHPEVVLPSSKIEHGYLGSPLYREEGHDWYLGRFADAAPGAVGGDVAVDYLLDADAPAAIAEHVAAPRLVAMLRNPVDRLVSAYFWSLRKNQLPNEPLDRHVEGLLRQPPGFPERHPDRFVDELVTRGFYGQQLEPYLDRFGPESLLVVLYDDVQQDPGGVVRRVYRHLGVDPAFVPESLGARPKVNTRNRAVIALERLTTGRKLARVTDRMHRLLSRVSEPAPELSDRQRAGLLDRFGPHIRHTEAVLERLPSENRPSAPRLSERWT
ncbi:sulfotransferase domain-containing protein [Rubrivirga sp.]|uniref:sulfotransferase domain-containing protein n=1 Tax=Rubrivirga sp. TaxID=1885344 RepID=UPI003B518045